LREYKLYLLDIENAIGKIQEYVKDLDFDAFKADSKTFDSVLYNIQVIGEAANKMPGEIREKHTAIDWRGIIGMRNVIVHGYFAVEPDTVWKTVRESLPILLEQILEIR